MGGGGCFESILGCLKILERFLKDNEDSLMESGRHSWNLMNKFDRSSSLKFFDNGRR